jgi:hypothetical protein
MVTKALRIRLSLVFALLGSLGLGCGSSTSSTPTSNNDSGTASNSSTPSAFGKKYAFTSNQVSGWSQDPASDALWTGAGTDLHLRIDGGDSAYTSKGCLLAMYQEMVGPNGESCTVVAMDFGTETQALDMFTYEQQHTAASIAIPQYDASVAVASSAIGGITAYAHITASYFEVQLTGFGDQEDTAAQSATQFLDILKAKTN